VKNLRVVCLGGGHGLAATLGAMRNLTPEVTAIVTVADNGGSSGRLREEFNSLPPGDLRMALAALCADDEWGRSWADILQYRFTSQGELNNHALGNLLLTALWDRGLETVQGLDKVGQLLKVVGRVLPMALEPLDIEATFATEGGQKVVRGQIEVAEYKGKVEDLKLIPRNPKVTNEANLAITKADWICIGPGSWLSSVMPHFLHQEQARMLEQSKAKKIIIFNLPDKKVADEYYDKPLEEHLLLVLKHAPSFRFDYALIDNSQNDADSRFYDLVKKCGGQVIALDLKNSEQNYRHDKEKLISAFSHILG
jgi:uncharacterized cofD-like protein